MHRHGILFLLIDDIELYLLGLCFWKYAPVQFRDDLINILLCLIALPRHYFKTIVHPYDLPVVHQKRIWDRKFLQQCVLYNTVLCRELYQIRHDQRFAVHVEHTDSDSIHRHNDRHHDSRLPVREKNPDGHRHKQNQHKNRPLHIEAELSF